MKILLILIISFVLVQPASAEFKKTKIAVLDFQVQGEKFETDDMGKIVSEWLITTIVKTGRFDVVERRLLEKILHEQKMGSSALIDQQSAAKLGRILGVRTIVTGTVTKLSGYLEVNARVISVETGSIITAEKVKASSAVKLDFLVSEIGEKIVRAFPLEGYIVNRSENNIVIDIGSLAGAQTGMKFIAYKEGKVIKHPKTGAVLDVETIQTGEVELNDVKEKTSSGIIIKETAPNAIIYGNLVKSVSSFFVVADRPSIMETPEKPQKKVKVEELPIIYSLAFEDVVRCMDLKEGSKAEMKKCWKGIRGKIVNWSGEVVNAKKSRSKSIVYINSGRKTSDKGYNVSFVTVDTSAANLKKGDFIRFSGKLVDYDYDRQRNLMFELREVRLQ